MAATLLKIHHENPEPRKINQVVECLKNGGVVIYPTDTVYGLGCDIHNLKAVERVAHIKGVKAEKTAFSFICHDLSHIAEYAKVSNAAYKLMRHTLPGAFTYLLPASSNVPKLLKSKTKKTVGIRVPNHHIPRQLVRLLGNPIITTSITNDDNYPTSIEDIFERYKNEVDIIIDGGIIANVPSTIVDCTTDDFEVVREGAGNISDYAYSV